MRKGWCVTLMWAIRTGPMRGGALVLDKQVGVALEGSRAGHYWQQVGEHDEAEDSWGVQKTWSGDREGRWG